MLDWNFKKGDLIAFRKALENGLKFWSGARICDH